MMRLLGQSNRAPTDETRFGLEHDFEQRKEEDVVREFRQQPLDVDKILSTYATLKELLTMEYGPPATEDGS